MWTKCTAPHRGAGERLRVRALWLIHQFLTLPHRRWRPNAHGAHLRWIALKARVLLLAARGPGEAFWINVSDTELLEPRRTDVIIGCQGGLLHRRFRFRFVFILFWSRATEQNSDESHKPWNILNFPLKESNISPFCSLSSTRRRNEGCGPSSFFFFFSKIRQTQSLFIEAISEQGGSKVLVS